MFLISGRPWFYSSRWTVNLRNESEINVFHSNRLALLWFTSLFSPEEMQQLYSWRSPLSPVPRLQAFWHTAMPSREAPAEAARGLPVPQLGASAVSNSSARLLLPSKNPPLPFKGITFYCKPKCRLRPQHITYLRYPPGTSRTVTAQQAFLLTRWTHGVSVLYPSAERHHRYVSYMAHPDTPLHTSPSALSTSWLCAWNSWLY